MRNITKTLKRAVALVVLISMASAIAEQPKAEIGSTAAKPSDLLNIANVGTSMPGTESGSVQRYDLNASLSGLVPFTPEQTMSYTVIATGFREYLATGWLDGQTQIILLYHDMDEPEAQMRASQFFSGLGETTMITAPPQMT